MTAVNAARGAVRRAVIQIMTTVLIKVVPLVAVILVAIVVLAGPDGSTASRSERCTDADRCAPRPLEPLALVRR